MKWKYRFCVLGAMLSWQVLPLDGWTLRINSFEYSREGGVRAGAILQAVDLGFAQGVCYDGFRDDPSSNSSCVIKAYLAHPPGDHWYVFRNFQAHWILTTNFLGGSSSPLEHDTFHVNMERVGERRGTCQTLLEKRTCLGLLSSCDELWKRSAEWVQRDWMSGDEDSRWVVWQMKGPMGTEQKPLVLSFEDVLYTPLACLDCRVACPGRLADVSRSSVVNNFAWSAGWLSGRRAEPGLMGALHLMCDSRLAVYFANAESQATCRTNALAFISGSVALVADEASEPFELESSFRCLVDARGHDGAASLERTPLCDLPVCRYTSPCREFRLHVKTGGAVEYGVGYYSAVLWLVRCTNPGGRTEILQPYYLLGHFADKEKRRRIVSLLVRMERLLESRKIGVGLIDGTCQARLYSQIETGTLDGDLEANRILEELFTLETKDCPALK